VATLFPAEDDGTRGLVIEEQPRLPLSYFEQPIPTPQGWEQLPCGYILFASAYEREAAGARATAAGPCVTCLASTCT
jgi:hypothetical protein